MKVAAVLALAGSAAAFAPSAQQKVRYYDSVVVACRVQRLNLN
jgi:hypothetical protein